jgi:hypothetical protein
MKSKLAKPITISKSVQAGLSALFEELRLSIQWNKPSVLLAVHSSRADETMVQAALEKKLNRLSQKIIRVNLRKNPFDGSFLAALSPSPQNLIYFFSHLEQRNNENSEKKVYRSLNLYREIFIENNIRAIFWLSKKEAADLPRYAPDFWAFRHRVIEFASRRPSQMKSIA